MSYQEERARDAGTIRITSFVTTEDTTVTLSETTTSGGDSRKDRYGRDRRGDKRHRDCEKDYGRRMSYRSSFRRYVERDRGREIDDGRRTSLKLILEKVQRRLQIESDRMKIGYDLKANTGGFLVGEKVWLYNPKIV